MSEKIFVKPKEKVLVRNADKPGAPHIKADGEWVIPSQYIMRRMRDGDLLRATPPADPEAKPAAGRRSTALRAET
jgi:hypothetical protein